MMKLFDAHCHLQDPRIFDKAPQLIAATLDSGVVRFAVNGVSEIGLDKGSHGKKVDFADQVNVFRQQLELAKELKRPASIHCVQAFGDLLQIMKSLGPFPAGVILHSFLGSAEMVPEFASLGAYFSFSGFLMSMKVNKAKRMLKMVLIYVASLLEMTTEELAEISYHNAVRLFSYDVGS
ncbi:deoxyribonuclease tatdn3 [Pyrus ussuriensis x Pyrus communis]|uniref:Deoxyribonuclease tatdn3 n=1 Tax=Pyrus ussuriensis x Pyrus communis TaxID=2448454 RepID=A0A5N5GTI0_9ROSA|nr:deoxyribonuclease tatdn3 [Pyrus ussuriensis x Pyrus communis]